MSTESRIFLPDTRKRLSRSIQAAEANLFRSPHGLEIEIDNVKMASIPDLAAGLMAHRTTADVVVEVLPQRMLRLSLEADHSIGQTSETPSNRK